MSQAKVTGQRSPRWAFMQKMTIPCENGLVYLARLRIVQTPWFAVYLHDIYEPDGDRDPHDHPWTFWSFVLRGGYTEALHPFPHVDSSFSTPNVWKRFTLHRMGQESAHRITEIQPGLKTLIFTGPRTRNWGFHTEDGFVPWQQYEKA